MTELEEKAASSRNSIQNRRILIVDDESCVRAVIRRFLQTEGYEMDEAETADQAVEKLRSKRYDIVMSDLRMPGNMTGLDIATFVHGQFPDTEVILMTGFPEMETAIEMLKQGVSDFLIKPLSREHLLSVVKRRGKERALREALKDANGVLENCVNGLINALEHFSRGELVGPARKKAELVIAKAIQLESLAASMKNAANENGGDKHE